MALAPSSSGLSRPGHVSDCERPNTCLKTESVPMLSLSLSLSRGVQSYGTDTGGSRPLSSARCWQVRLTRPGDMPQSPLELEVSHQLRHPCPPALRL